MPGTLIPRGYQQYEPSLDDMTIVSVIWGMTLGLSVVGLFRVAEQTYHQYRRKRKVTSYMALIWLELTSSTIFGGLGWGVIHGRIPPNLGAFLGIIIVWIVQVQCILQIIVNRIALLAISPAATRRLRWGVFAAIAFINIAVASIWIPSRLQVNQTWTDINKIFDRIEKALFLLVDAGLNCYFVYLVRSSLIEYGLTKYNLLYRFNIVMILVSVSMDVLIIAMMSLPNSIAYAIFHPLGYLVKLHIELCMADLIARIVRATGNQLTCDCACHVDNPYPLGQDLNDQPARHSAPAVLDQVAQAHTKKHSRRESWRRSLRILGFNDSRREDNETQSGRTSWGMRMPPPIEGTHDGSSRSWVRKHSHRQDSGFWMSSFTSTNKSSNNNDH